MKIFLMALTTPMILSGCVIGNGRICGPQTPLANCNAEVYERLVHPKLNIEYWIKPGIDKDQRVADVETCGGGKGHNPPSFSMQTINEARKSGETNNEVERRLYFHWQACMVNLGYRYTKDCTKISQEYRGPGCQAQRKEAPGPATQKP